MKTTSSNFIKSLVPPDMSSRIGTHSLPLKLLFVFLGSELGGAERQGLLLARYLKERRNAKIEVWSLGSSQLGRVGDICAEFGLVWHGVPFPKGNDAFTSFWQLLRLAGQMRRARPNAIFAYTWLPNILCGLVWRLSGARAFIWNQRDEGLGLNFSRLHRLAIRLTCCFVANSAKGRDYLIETYGLGEKCFPVIYNGVPLTPPKVSRSVLRNNLGIQENILLVCMVGNLHRNKDHTTLVRAWRLVIDHMQSSTIPLLLVLAGRFDELAEPLQILVADLGLSDHVRFLGELHNVMDLLFASDLYVHSSPSEGLPNGVLEAMAAGLPVVGTFIPGIIEALGKEMADCLAPIGDAEALAGKIISMINDADRRSTLGAANRRRIAEEFDVEKMGGHYLALLNSCLEPKTREG